MVKSKVFSRHAFGNLSAHVVFCTKYRKDIFKFNSLEFMTIDALFDNLAKNGLTNLNDYIILNYGIAINHIHMVIEYAPNVALCDIIMSIKNFTAREFNKSFKQKGHLWERGYFAESIGTKSLAKLNKYVNNQ